MTTYEWGRVIAAVFMIAAGVSMSLRAINLLRRSQTQAQSQLTPIAQSPTPPPAPQPAPTSDDYFFASPVSAVPVGTTPPPAVPPAGLVGAASSYQQLPTPTAAASQGWDTKAIFLLIAGVVLALVGTTNAYHRMWPSGRTIELPETLAGIDQLDPNSDAGRQMQSAVSDMRNTTAGTPLETQVYYEDGHFIIVAAADGVKDTDAADFFEGADAGSSGLGLTLVDVPPGSLAGQLKCSEKAVNTLNACVWVDEDTVGILVGSADMLDSTKAASIREEIEHW
ncbi:MAG TPA: hypothetical protein VMT88_10165 [Actinomycetes bacterium]|nr:hypothetical protein [Actinomycetes bacterium]